MGRAQGRANKYDFEKAVAEQRKDYESALPNANPDWPIDVRVFYAALAERLFDPDVTITDVRSTCGVRNHNISSRFRDNVGMSPLSFLRHHRMKFAHVLLTLQDARVTNIPLAYVAFAVGYQSHGGFSKAFKQHFGAPPSHLRA